MMYSYILILAFLCVVHSDVIVETESGKIAGKEVLSIFEDKKYYSFLGIPFAQPPVENLRFKPPVPHHGWEDTLPAKREKKACAQFFLPIRTTKKHGFFGSEDCLYLSIHTPKLPEEEELKLPVIVFVYNEFFRISFNGSQTYGPDFFMDEDVVFVTVNHRLGSFGFMSFEDELIPGNNGIRDIILALKWLHTNVNKFGGDPNKITLMGHQGGATVVDILLNSPKAKGLFTAAILQSGSSRDPSYFDDNPRKHAIALTEVLEDKATTSKSLIERMSNVPTIKIPQSELLTVHADVSRSIQRGVHPFGPVVEIDHPDAIIRKLPEENPVPLEIPVMIGFNSREGIEMNERFLAKPQYLTFADRDFLLIFPKRVNYHFKINDNIYYEAVQEVKDFYFDEGYVKISKPGEHISYMGDVANFYHIDMTVKDYSNISKSEIYYYMFDYSGELNFRKKAALENSVTIEGTYGATVADELCYLFVCHPHKKIYKQLLQDENSEEIKVLKTMVKLWTNFAKFGNPTPPDSEFIWKPATTEDRECLIISDELKMQSKLHHEKIQFWDQFIEKYQKMAVNGVVQDDIKDEL